MHRLLSLGPVEQWHYMLSVSAMPRQALLLALLVGVCLGTVPGTARAWRGLAELDRSAPLGPVVWRQDLSLEYQPGNLSEAEQVRVRVAIEDAIGVWLEPDCGQVSVRLISGSMAGAVAGDDRSTIVVVTEGWDAVGMEAEASGATTEVRVRRHADGSREIVEADIYVNADTIAWDFADSRSPHRLREAIVHELGHALGLLHPCAGTPDDPCTGVDSIMIPDLAAESRALGADDRVGLCALYPREAARCPSEAVCGSDQSCTHGSCVDLGSDLGAPCVSPADCSTRACHEPGVCTRSCATEECPAGWSCAESGNGRVCLRPRSPGTPCATGSDCASGLCLSGALAAPICTVLCPLSGCLGGSCEPVDGRLVCVPASDVGERASSGCSATRRVGRTGVVAVPFLLLWLFLRSSRRSSR